MALQERDLHLLREIAEMRVIDREQAKLVGGFGSTTRVNTRLLALTRSGLLRRFFLGGPAGRAKALYAISAKAAQLIGSPTRGPRQRHNGTLAGEALVEHQLRLNGIYCALKYRPNPADVPKLTTWRSFSEPIAPSSKLIPDGYAEFVAPDKSFAAFFEIDLGTEFYRVWTAKVQAYLVYAASGDFERRFHQSRFRVLVVTTSARRLDSLRQATAAVTERVFWFATLEDVEKVGFCAPIWSRPKDSQQKTLWE